MSVTCSQGSKSLNKELDSLQLLILEIFLYFHNTIQFVQEPVINACQFVYLIHCIVLVKRLEMKSNRFVRFTMSIQRKSMTPPV